MPYYQFLLRRRLKCAYIMSAAVLTPVLLLAQTPAASNEPLKLSPFVVDTTQETGYMAKDTLSGTGSNTNLMNLPQSVDIANLQLIQDLGAGTNDLMKTLEMTTGSIVRRSWNNGDDQFLWGFRINNSMMDGVPRGVTQSTGEMYDIDRVEVVKGPAAMLFGQASFVGGVINYVTRQPTATPHYEVSVSDGSFHWISLSAHASGPVPFLNGLTYRADFGATETRGPRTGTYTRDRFFGSALQYVLPVGLLKVEGSYYPEHSYHTITMIDPTVSVLNGGIKVLDNGDPDFTLNQKWARYDITTSTANVTLLTKLGEKFSSKAYIGYNDLIQDITRDSPFGNINLATHTIDIRALIAHNTTHNTFAQETILKEFDTSIIHHKLTLIGDARFSVIPEQDSYAYEEYPQTTYDYTNPVHPYVPFGPYITTNYHSEVRQRISGGTFQEEASLLDERINLLYGLRYNDFLDVDGPPILTFNNTTDPTLFQNTSAGSLVTHRYGALVHPVKNVSAYYNWSQAFLFNSGTTTLPLNNPTPLVPSLATNKEEGIKAEFFNGALRLNAAHFDIVVTNVRVVAIQDSNDPQPGNSKIVQDGYQKNKGYDLSANYSQKIGGGTADFIGTYYHGNLLSSGTVNGINNVLTKPLGIANNTASAWGVYEFGSGFLSKLKVGLGARYTGEMVGPATPVTSLATRRPDYWVSRAVVGYRWRNSTIQLNVENLGNVKYIDGVENAFWITTDPGRSYRLTVTQSF